MAQHNNSAKPKGKSCESQPERQISSRLSTPDEKPPPASRPLLQDDLISIVHSAQAGDSKAFSALFRYYKVSLFRDAILLGCDVATAEDLVQETFLRAWKRLKNLNDAKSFKPWLVAILKNLNRDRIREEKRHPTVRLEDCVGSDIDNQKFDPADTRPTPHEHVVNLVMDERIEDALKKLTEVKREIIRLSFFLDEELSVEEVSKLLGLPPGTVASHKSRSLKYLRKTLGITD